MNTIERAALTISVGAGIGWAAGLAAFYYWLTHHDDDLEAPWLTP